MDTRQYRPEASSSRAASRAVRWALSRALAGCVVVVAALLVLWHVLIGSPVSGQQYSPPNPPAPLTTAYYGIVEEQIAQSLNLSVAQVKADIAADPNEGLFGVATARGLSPDELYAREIAALQTASDDMIASGQWTQAQDDATMRYWRARGAKALGADLTDWFLHR